jgi:hypothetical protein
MISETTGIISLKKYRMNGITVVNHYKLAGREELTFNRLLAHVKSNISENVFFAQVNTTRQDVEDEFEHFYRAFKYIMAYEDVALNI